MKKTELIQLHQLFSEIAKFADDVTEINDYLDVGVRPQHIQKYKSEHNEAIFVLLDCLIDNIDGEEHLESIEEQLEDRTENLKKVAQ